jgi:hypothetical protein
MMEAETFSETSETHSIPAGLATQEDFEKFGHCSFIFYNVPMETLVARNTNVAMMAPVAGSGGVFVWRESGL